MAKEKEQISPDEQIWSRLCRQTQLQAARSFWLRSKFVPPVDFLQWNVFLFLYFKFLQQASLNKRGRGRQRNKMFRQSPCVLMRLKCHLYFIFRVRFSSLNIHVRFLYFNIHLCNITPATSYFLVWAMYLLFRAVYLLFRSPLPTMEYVQ